MSATRKRKSGHALGVMAAAAVMFGTTPLLGTVYADSGSQSNSPYAVLGTVSTPPAALTLDQPYVPVGGKLAFQASGLPANTTLNLVWETYTGTWQTQAEHFIGAAYTTGNTVLKQVTTDANGDVNGSFTTPSGFGDAHMVGLVDAQGNVLAAGVATLTPTAKLSSTSEPEGDFFHVHVDGLGVGGYTSVYQVLYDNHLMGNVSAVTTGGVADFTVRAEGGVGTHTLQLIVGGVEGPYLNAAQSPFSFRPNQNFVVHVTPGHPVTTSDPLPTPAPATGNHLTASAGSGKVGDKFTVSGSSLTPNHDYKLVWNTMAGSRVSGKGYETKQIPLGDVTTDANGKFSTSVTVPDDLGGPAHTIQLLDGSDVAGDTTFRIYPTLVNAPKNVVAGQQFTVDLQGVGWTEYDNTYAIDYDNGTIGYVCGFNSHGDVSVQLQASGTPGVHYIDIYPSVYKGQQTLPYWYGIPLLTYAKDHPGDDLPAIHVAVNVLPAGSISLNVNGKDAGTVYAKPLSGLDTGSSVTSSQVAVPLYNVMSELKNLGISSRWNGHTWSITDSKVSKVPSLSGHGNFSVTVNGKSVLTSTSSVDKVPGSNTPTTFVSMDTLDSVLSNLGLKSTFDGTTWSWSTK